MAWQQRGTSATLHIQNVSYQFQGQYICEASNVINGHEYKVTSQEIAIDVTGAPQVLRESSRTKTRVVVEKDEDATIAVYFCSDPPPRRAFWEWGSLKLETGETRLRYAARPLHTDEGAKDCFEAQLIVRGVDGTDSRKYTLNVENERGSETFAVSLEVREPVAMSVVIGVVVGCIVLLLIVTLVILYLLKAERMCFNRKGFKPENSDSGRSSGAGAIPPDALYAKKDNRPLYENLKPPDKNRNDASLVYASLDLAANGAAASHNPPRRDETEYAEIRFQPPQMYEQASL